MDSQWIIELDMAFFIQFPLYGNYVCYSVADTELYNVSVDIMR